ncbi:MAG: GatB/YqeY domain-containing protein [Betaproteobacteria bacterium]
MSLKERITADMKDAMRARDAARLSAVRLLLAAIKQFEVDQRTEAGDADVIAITGKLIKQRRDAADQYDAAAREDLAARERAEIEVISVYLPQALSEAEIVALIDAAIAQSGASGPQAMGKVMGLLKPQLAGRADIAQVSAQVKARLSA